MSHPSLQIARTQATALTPAQRRFNTLIRQIAQARQTLAAWQEQVPIYREADARVLVPLQDELLAASRRWVVALDGLLDQKGLTATERATLRDLLCGEAGRLLAGDSDDAELKALHDKHAEVDFDAAQREEAEAMKGLAAAPGLGSNDDGDADDTEGDAVEDLFERMQQQAAVRDAERNARAAGRRQSAARKRREEEAKHAAQSLREIFRKLASALHPDRETDEGERQAKTALMQRVNQAYAANDLLTLLELQLQIEQIDASHIAQASATRLKHYNKVLEEQLAELEAEIERADMAWRIEFGVNTWQATDPRKLGAVLERTSRRWRGMLAEIQLRIRMLGNVAATKQWLKAERRRMRDSAFDLPF